MRQPPENSLTGLLGGFFGETKTLQQPVGAAVGAVAVNFV